MAMNEFFGIKLPVKKIAYEDLWKTYHCTRCKRDYNSLLTIPIHEIKICDKKDCYQRYLERKKLLEE